MIQDQTLAYCAEPSGHQLLRGLDPPPTVAITWSRFEEWAATVTRWLVIVESLENWAELGRLQGLRLHLPAATLVVVTRNGRTVAERLARIEVDELVWFPNASTELPRVLRRSRADSIRLRLARTIQIDERLYSHERLFLLALLRASVPPRRTESFVRIHSQVPFQRPP